MGSLCLICFNDLMETVRAMVGSLNISYIKKMLLIFRSLVLYAFQLIWPSPKVIRVIFGLRCLGCRCCFSVVCQPPTRTRSHNILLELLQFGELKCEWHDVLGTRVIDFRAPVLYDCSLVDMGTNKHSHLMHSTSQSIPLSKK